MITTRFSEELDVYKGFFDHEWFKNLHDMALSSNENSAFAEIILELGATWKGISNARQMPWLMMENLKGFASSFINSHTPIPIQILNKLVNRIAIDTEKKYFSLNTKQQNELSSVIRAIETDTIQSIKNDPFVLDVKHLWDDLINIPGFSMSLWMSEVNSYGAIYFAYEDFLLKSLKGALKIEHLKAGKIPTLLKKWLGKNIMETCWNEEHIEIARLIRHAIVHRGRKLTTELEKFKSKLVLEENDEIVILACDTTNLYNLLKERVSVFSEEFIKLNPNKKRAN